MVVPTPWAPDFSLVIPAGATTAIILISVGLAAIFTAFVTFLLTKIRVNPAEQHDEGRGLTMGVNDGRDVLQRIWDIQCYISEGATSFLVAEYKFMSGFIVVFSAVILILLGATTKDWSKAGFSTLAFILGAATSIASGWIGMRIAVYTNARTALMAARGYADGFITAFRGGIVMGFALTTLGLLNLFIGICLFRLHFGFEIADAPDLFSAIAAYGLGGSSIAMFGRVGGGIFTKAADVGADLVGKVEQKIPEDDPRNPGVIADCIGDNVGDIAGMGSDLFGSFGEATCAAMVVASTTPALAQSWTCMLFPLTISAAGLVICIITTFFATNMCPANDKDEIEPVLKYQLLISCLLGTCVSCILSFFCLPPTFDMYFMNGVSTTVHNWGCFIAIASGLWAGLGIGYITEYFTSNRYAPVQSMAEACTTGAATNIIHGLAVGYKSAVIPAILLAFCIYISYNMAGMYGIALGAIGILSTMAICLTVDAYGPISDNAGGIAEMAGMGEHVRERTDALDAAGNTTAAIGKGYAIGSAALVGLALYGAFLTQMRSNPAEPVNVSLTDPRTFFGLVLGAMLPFWFTAMTMKSVGYAAMEMVREIQYQFRNIEGLMEGTAKPNYKNCVKIATDASLKEMIAPGCLVVFTPILIGIFFGHQALAGLLPGSLVCGIQLAISSANSGGAWDNAKKFVEAGNMGAGKGKGSDVHAAAVIGDTVGDPLKDTSGPALNILVKLMAIISVVFAPVVAPSSPLGGLIFNKWLKTAAARDEPPGSS